MVTIGRRGVPSLVPCTLPWRTCVCTVMLGACVMRVRILDYFLSDVLSPLRPSMFGFGFWFRRIWRLHSSTPAVQAVPPLWRAWPIERVAAAVVSDVAVVSDDGVTTASAEAAVDHRVERKSQGEPSERAAVSERPQHWMMELSQIGYCRPSRGRSPGTAACRRRPSCEATSMAPSEASLTRRHARVWSRSPCAAGPAKLQPTPTPAPTAQ